MAHLLLVVEAKSFTKGKELIQGTYERLIEHWESVKHPFSGGRTGYNQAHYSSFHFIAPRLKEECIQDHINTIRCQNLNPITLRPQDWGAIMPNFLAKRIWPQHWKSHGHVSVGGLFEIIRICMHFFCKLPFVPLCSVPDVQPGTNETQYRAEWYYAYCFGYIKDIRKYKKEEEL